MLKTKKTMTEFEIKNFCSYEASKAMKEVGFDEPCMAFYYMPRAEFRIYIDNPETGTVFNLHDTANKSSVHASAPLFTQATQWFWDKHKLEILLSRIKGEVSACIYLNDESEWFESYPDMAEAYNSAIIKACGTVKERQQNQ